MNRVVQRLRQSLLLLTLAAARAYGDCSPFEVVGDGIPLPLAGLSGDADAGLRAATERQRGDCSICHRLPLPDDRFHGNVGPDLSHIATRLTVPQIRLRVAANRHLNPESVMPDYCISGGRHAVAKAFKGRSILSAKEIEDIVVWLSSFDGRTP